MQQQATVIAVHDGRAQVRAGRLSACGGCAGKASCSTLGSWQARYSEVEVENVLSARVGDVVVLEVPDRLMLTAMFRLYGVPMIAFVVAGVLFRSLAIQAGWPQPDLLAVGAGVVAVALSYLWAGRADTRKRIEVRMLEVIEHVP